MSSARVWRIFDKKFVVNVGLKIEEFIGGGSAKAAGVCIASIFATERRWTTSVSTRM